MAALRLACLAMLLLSACAEDHVALDIARLRDGDALGRRHAAEALGREPKDARAVAPLIAALRDSDNDVRCAAATSLGALDAREAVEPLLVLLRGGPGDWCAIEPLGELGDARAVPPLVERFDEGRARAALGKLGTAAVVPLVTELDEGLRPDQAIAIGEVLARADAEAALPLLLARLEVDAGFVAGNAAWALGGLGDPRAVEPLLAAFREGNGNAGQALAQLGGAALPGLEAHLREPSAPHRDRAAANLGETRDPTVIPILERGVVDADPVVARGSARALAHLAGAHVDPSQASAGFPLHDPAAALLEARWHARDLQAIAHGMVYFERAHRDDVATLQAALDAHGDMATATALLNSRSGELRAVGARWGQKRGLKPCSTGPGNWTCR